MTARDDTIRMATKAGILEPGYPVGDRVAGELERFASLVTERERAARQAAQIQVEQLQERIARAGIEQRRAVLAMRERCSKVCDEVQAKSRQHLFRSGAAICAGEIRALKDLGAPDLRPSLKNIVTDAGRDAPDQQTGTLFWATPIQIPPAS